MILHDLKTTGSIAAKEMMLKLADTFDKKMFEYAYNSNKIYNLKFNSINWKSIKPLSDMDIVILDKILNHSIYGDNAREVVHKHCLEYGDLIKLIINKDLDCGVKATTLNKVFGKNFIFQFKAQKAKEIPIRNVVLPVLGQIKYNGIRCIAHVYKDRVLFRTYNGKVFKYDALEGELLNIKDKNFVLDGELCIGDSKGTNHTAVGGKVNSSIKTGKSIVGSPFTFNVFDTMSIEDFDNQVCADEYTVRFERTTKIVQQAYSNLVKVSETFYFRTHEDIEEKYNELLRDGYEGMILKHEDHKYMFRKTRDWIKLKDVKTCDIECIDYEEGTPSTKYEGLIGSLICKGVVEGKEVTVNVGSGLSDAQRAEDPNNFVGHILEIKYNSLIVDSDTLEWSLFLPRFVAVRFDK